MEAEVIKRFLPDLVTAISDNVQSVSDQCLAKGLITKPVHERVLESGGTSKDRARTLLVAVQNSTETDSMCLEILLSILEQELPHASRVKLLSEIRKEVTEMNTCRTVAPSTEAIQQLQPGELAKESALQQSSLLGRYEDSIRQHEHACAEKSLLEERLKVKSEKCKTLKEELETLRSQHQEAANTRSRISACTIQIKNLKKRIKELQKTIEEQGMKAKRGRNTVITQTKKMFDILVNQSQLEIQKREELIARLRESETLASKKEEEIKMKDSEHQLIQERESRKSELEEKSKPQKESHTATTAVNILPNDILKPNHLQRLYRNMLGSTQNYSCKKNWRKIGSHLGFSEKELDDIHPQKSDDDDDEQTKINHGHFNSCSEKMLDQWLHWFPQDSHGSTSFPTYSALQRALVNAGFGNIVRDFSSYESITSNEKSPDWNEEDDVDSDVEDYEDYFTEF